MVDWSSDTVRPQGVPESSGVTKNVGRHGVTVPFILHKKVDPSISIVVDNVFPKENRTIQETLARNMWKCAHPNSLDATGSLRCWESRAARLTTYQDVVAATFRLIGARFFPVYVQL